MYKLYTGLIMNIVLRTQISREKPKNQAIKQHFIHYELCESVQLLDTMCIVCISIVSEMSRRT